MTQPLTTHLLAIACLFWLFHGGLSLEPSALRSSQSGLRIVSRHPLEDVKEHDPEALKAEFENFMKESKAKTAQPGMELEKGKFDQEGVEKDPKGKRIDPKGHENQQKRPRKDQRGQKDSQEGQKGIKKEQKGTKSDGKEQENEQKEGRLIEDEDKRCSEVLRMCDEMRQNVTEAEERLTKAVQMKWQWDRADQESNYMLDAVKRLSEVEEKLKERGGNPQQVSHLLEWRLKKSVAAVPELMDSLKFMGDANLPKDLEDLWYEWGMKLSYFKPQGPADSEISSLKSQKEKTEKALKSAYEELWSATADHNSRIKAYETTQCSIVPLPNESSKGLRENLENPRNGHIRLAEHAWKLDWKLYESQKNVSFILQYFKQPGQIEDIVRELHRCTKGGAGQGELGKGITSELLVNVDDDAEADLWLKMYKTYGDFVTPVFSNNIHEQRAYNRLGRMAAGQVLIFLQDDVIPPANCTWVSDTLKVFNAWPRVGIVGLNVGIFKLGGGRMEPTLPKPFIFLRDPTIDIPMQFVTAVDVGPLAVRKNTFDEIGLFNEAYSIPGENALNHDWEVSCRTWLAGWQVAQVPIRPHHFITKARGGTHTGPQLAVRKKLDVLNHQYWARYGPYMHLVTEELGRLNKLLEPIFPECREPWVHDILWHWDNGPFCMTQEEFEKKRTEIDAAKAQART